MKHTPLSLAASILLPVAALAGPLQEAKINQIVNDVKVVDPQKGARPAALQDSVRDQIGVRTGIQSRAELLFQDATLTRLGAETFFSFKEGTRDVTLERGTMLLQVPKNRGGARIRTASVTASITGTTIMIESLPKKHVKVLVLEGSLRLSANGRFGESISLKPGKMIIMEANAKRLPNPVDVDLRKVVKTSALVDPQLFKGKSEAKVAPLPSLALIDKEIGIQAQRVGEKNLIATNLVIAGNGTEVNAVSEQVLAALDNYSPQAGGEQGSSRAQNSSQRTGQDVTNRVIAAATTAGADAASGTDFAGDLFTAARSGEAGTEGGNSGGAARRNGGGNSGGPGGGSGGAGAPTAGGMTSPADLVVGNLVNVSGALTATGAIIPSGGAVSNFLPFSISAGSITAGDGVRMPGANATPTSAAFGGAILAEFFAPELTFSPGGINGVFLMGGDALTGAGGNGGSIFMGVSRPIPRNVNIGAPINASTGANGGAVAFGGIGGNVFARSRETIDVSSTVKVSESSPGAASARAGTVVLQSLKTSGTAIRIQNSGQLLSLLANAAPGHGGLIHVISSGGEIIVDGGRVQADRGSVQLRNDGANGRITLRNADIRGDTVRIGALGANGQLVVGGGTINADTTLKLYGGSSNGTVRFVDNVTLGGEGTKIIAGRTVTIDNGRTVTVGGSNPARVHTVVPNYSGSGGNGSTTGQFGGAGATTQSFGSRPSF